MQNSNTNDREVVDALDLAANKYAENKSSSPVFREAHITDFKAGAEWQSQNQALPLTDDELYRVAANFANDKMKDYVGGSYQDREYLRQGFEAGYKANRGSYTLEDLEKAFSAGDDFGNYDFIQRNKLEKQFAWLQDEPLNKEQYITSLLK